MAEAARIGVVVVSGALIVSCSAMPDEINPARLFQDGEAPPPPGADEEFPNLAEVPDEPRPASTPAQIREVREGLIADRENARYTDAELRNRSIDEVDFATAPAPAGETRRPISGGGDPDAAVAEAEEIARAAAARAEAVRAAQEAEQAAAATAPSDQPAQPAVRTQAASVDVFKEEFSDAFNAESNSPQAVISAPSSIVRFAPQSKELGPEQRVALKEIAAAHAQGGGMIRVIGHAPASGGGGTLAYDRALAAAAALEALGVPVDRMRVLAGAVEPNDADGPARDRVDIFVER